jgi:hypothetical protein
MGVLTDFVVADRNDAQRVCDSDCPSQEFAGLDAKGIDAVKLGALHAILTGGELDPSFMADGSVCSRGEDGPWVFEVPADLVQRLARLNARQLRAVGAKWAATEEFSPRYENWPAEAVQQVLADLARLCKQAVGEGKAVLMWLCL